ncbi:hypothetical protein [Gimibacter soli]|uniref:Uncharacterized protein n=1 Tax=Gimibacter soli TaxID=3024400 RepID=A0AAE9XRY5_9PROT|nr:hypothetical protein [Gimibacter soli]WCL55192.1 hypothetical protein PH603_05390 [Gimibacter soli]
MKSEFGRGKAFRDAGQPTGGGLKGHHARALLYDLSTEKQSCSFDQCDRLSRFFGSLSDGLCGQLRLTIMARKSVG